MNEPLAPRNGTGANATAGRDELFDVAGWIDQAQRAGKKPTAIIYADGNHSLAIYEGKSVGGPHLGDIPAGKKGAVIDALIRQGSFWRYPDASPFR